MSAAHTCGPQPRLRVPERAVPDNELWQCVVMNPGSGLSIPMPTAATKIVSVDYSASSENLIDEPAASFSARRSRVLFLSERFFVFTLRCI
eukprot:m.334571 g.334571  ORF g.334571 m.334571 type:complete len:91 (-) comp55670_c1_seq4:403-675(-)